MLRLNPKIIKMGKKLYDDAVLVRIDSLTNPQGGRLPMSDEQREDLGSPITWALTLGMTTSEANSYLHDKDSLEWITGVHSLVDLMGDIPWTNIDGNHVATTDPQIFPKYNIYFEQPNVQYDINWKDFLSFTNTYLAGISLNDFTKEFHGLPAEVFIRHNETNLLFPLSIFEWRYNAINNKII